MARVFETFGALRSSDAARSALVLEDTFLKQLLTPDCVVQTGLVAAFRVHRARAKIALPRIRAGDDLDLEVRNSAGASRARALLAVVEQQRSALDPAGRDRELAVFLHAQRGRVDLGREVEEAGVVLVVPNQVQRDQRDLPYRKLLELLGGVDLQSTSARSDGLSAGAAPVWPTNGVLVGP